MSTDLKLQINMNDTQSILNDCILESDKVRLEPLTRKHTEAMSALVKDGKLWQLTVTSAPEPEQVLDYIESALHKPDKVPFAVIDSIHDQLIGTTSYHDILPDVKRLEIGYTFYGKSYWRTHVNTHCKYLLLSYAFDTLGYQTVGWRTDDLNIRSQNAIERLGARKDGVIRGHKLRRDGTVRNTVMYSMIAEEWPAAKHNLQRMIQI